MEIGVGGNALDREGGRVKETATAHGRKGLKAQRDVWGD